MGAVYVAVDERFGSTVAIKQTLCMDDNYRRAIEREARLLNSLKHVALPRVSDHFIEDNGQYIVMEYVPGEDLFCILEETGKPFHADQVLQWADQLLDALDFLHNQGNPVIHRDIKPQNLKIMPSGQIILLDFGLAKGNPTDAQNNTAAKSIFGYSRNYASLEQIQGTGTDPRSDLYSLAATIYHLVTGVPPEDALTRAMAVLSNQPDPLRPAHTLNEDVPIGMSVILQQTLDLNAGGRPATAIAMREMLRDHKNYAHLATPYAASRGSDVSLHDQKTRLFHEKTAAAAPPVTDIKTDVLPTGLSELTVAKASSDPGRRSIETVVSKSAGGRKLAWSAAGLFALLLSGAVIGGVLYYENSAVGGPVTTEAVPEPLTSNVLENSSPDLVSEVNMAGSNSDSGNEAPAGIPHAAQPPGKKKEVASVQPAVPEPPLPRMVIEEDGERIVIEGDTIYMGNQTIKTGRLQPSGTLVDPKNPRPLPPGAQPPDAWRGLTPVQIRRLRDALRKAANANANVSRPPQP